MLSIGKLTLGQQRYYVDQVAAGIEDYYAGAGEASGRWVASSAQLGLEGEVDADVLREVLSANDPTGTYRLIAGGNRKVAGFDLTFSAPKSVSVVWALGDPGVNLAVSQAHDAAVEAALGYVEREATFTRRGHGGVDVIDTEGLIAAAFRHRTSRNGDPQLHTHVVVANVVLGTDGKWSTLDGRAFYRHAAAAGHLYQAQLRHELTRTLGVAWTPVERGTAEIVGVPRHVLEAFSTRRTEIEAELALTGASSAGASRTAALATRRAKREMHAGHLFEGWRAQADELGFDAAAVDRVVGRGRPLLLSADHGRAIEDHLLGPVGLTETASTFTRHDVVRSVAGLAPTGMTAHAVEQQADRLLQRAEVLRVGDPAAGRFSTRELVAIEIAAINAATGSPLRGIGMCAARNVNGVLRREVTLGEDQRDMVRRLTSSGNGVDLVVAPAGTGKTYAMSFAREVWRRSGYRVTGVALAGRAAAELETSAGIPSHTFAGLERRMSRSPLTNRDVVVVDEAGMVGTRILAPLLIAAARAKAKVVLMGDFRQLPEMEAGGLLRGLAERIEPVVLNENRRQREMWERVALVDLRDGDLDHALTAYQTHERVRVARDVYAARVEVVDAWMNLETAGERALMLAARGADVRGLNQLARQHLTAAGRLSGPGLAVGDRVFQVGDRVVATRNDYPLHIRNGHTGTAIALNPTDRSLTVAFDHGITTHVPAQYIARGHLDHGYAITIHKAQGITADHAILLATTGLSRELAYVAMSRGRKTNTFQLAEPATREHAHGLDAAKPSAIDHLREQIQREQIRTLAIDD